MASADNKAAILAKYRATEQFKDALKIIKPAPESQKQCEYDLASQLWAIEHAAKMDKFKSVRTPAQYRDLLEKNLVPTLRKAIKLTAKAFPPEYQIRRGKDFPRIGEELNRHLKETELAINWTRERVRKGSPLQSYARIAAADAAAYLLLLRSSKKLTGVGGRFGRLHKLAKVLFGNEQADLFDYLEPRLERLRSVLKAVAATR